MKDMREIAAVGGVNTTEPIRPAVTRDRTSEIAATKGVESKDPANMPAGRDRVTIDRSAEAAQIAAAAREAATKVRSTRLVELEAAIRRDVYQPDPRKIAEQILNDAELMARIHLMFAPPK